MFNKSINSTMQDFKKQLPRKPFISPQEQAKEQQKENSLLEKYQQKLAQKKNHRRLLQRAQKIAMNQKLKEIVSDNVQYFRNIIQAKDLHKPNDHSLKLPTRMVPSLYKTEFPKRKQYESQNSSVDMKKSFFDRSKNFSQSKLPLSTTYQNEFKKIDDIQSKKYQRSMKGFSQLFQKKHFTINAPSFLDTQNQLQFRNWGTGAVMPSMKPSPKVATTDIPFKATSMYRSDFHNVSLPKTKIVTHQETFPHNVDMWMNNSSYCNDFNRKKTNGPQKNYKPVQNPGATNLPLKSTTQYKQSFIESSKLQSNEKKNKKSSIKKLTNQDIERLVSQL